METVEVFLTADGKVGIPCFCGVWVLRVNSQGLKKGDLFPYTHIKGGKGRSECGASFFIRISVEPFRTEWAKRMSGYAAFTPLFATWAGSRFLASA